MQFDIPGGNHHFFIIFGNPERYSWRISLGIGSLNAQCCLNCSIVKKWFRKVCGFWEFGLKPQNSFLANKIWEVPQVNLLGKIIINFFSLKVGRNWNPDSYNWLNWQTFSLIDLKFCGKVDSREEKYLWVSGSREICVLVEGELSFFQGLTIISFGDPERNFCRILIKLGAFDAPCPQKFFTI